MKQRRPLWALIGLLCLAAMGLGVWLRVASRPAFVGTWRDSRLARKKGMISRTITFRPDGTGEEVDAIQRKRFSLPFRWSTGMASGRQILRFEYPAAAKDRPAEVGWYVSENGRKLNFILSGGYEYQFDRIK